MSPSSLRSRSMKVVLGNELYRCWSSERWRKIVVESIMTMTAFDGSDGRGGAIGVRAGSGAVGTVGVYIGI